MNRIAKLIDSAGAAIQRVRARRKRIAARQARQEEGSGAGSSDTSEARSRARGGTVRTVFVGHPPRWWSGRYWSFSCCGVRHEIPDVTGDGFCSVCSAEHRYNSRLRRVVKLAPR